MSEEHDRLHAKPAPEVFDELLRDPSVRAELAGVLAESLAERRPPSLWARLQPWLAGAVSAAVTILAFFLPSLQDQWDRLESRQVIQRYVELGRSFRDEGRYQLAEEAFAKALELSENRRLDIEEERLEARIERLNADPSWGRSNPSGLQESDFLYLIHLRSRPGEEKRRAAALASYGVFLAGEGRLAESDSALRSAVRLDSTSGDAFVNLGNVQADLERPAEAERAYRRAIALDPRDASARYDLALLLQDRGRAKEAEAELRETLALAPFDHDALRALVDLLSARGASAEAAELRARLARLPAREPSADVPPDSGKASAE